MKKYNQKEKSLTLIAFASLSYANEPLDEDNILFEKDRIESIIQDDYIADDPMEYNEYVLDWLQKNAHELVYTGLYDQ